MDDDRKDAFCWHGVKLYDCQDPEHATPKATASRRDNYRSETVVYYRGSGQFYVPITDRDSDMYGGSTIHDVGPCPHRHTTIEAAEKCGATMTDRAVREWNHRHGIR